MTNKRINATVTIGGTVSGSFKTAIDTAAHKVSYLGATMRHLEQAQTAVNNRTGKFFGMGNAELGKMVSGYTALSREQEKMLARQRREKTIRDGIAGAGMAIGMAGAAVGLGMVPIREAAAFETAMLGVAKQVDGARDSSGNLTAVYFDMAKQIRLLGRDLPMSTKSIAEMVAAGSRMGIAKNELIEFTRTAAMMADAFELPAGELAEQMGKIKGLFGLKTQEEVRALADSINYLDDNAIAKGGDIIEFMQRVGGVAGSVKISGKQMAALGSTLLTLGERTETAGTAVNAMMQKFGAAEKGTKKMRAALAAVGLSARSVQKGMQVDAQATVIKVMEAINKMPKEHRLGLMVDLVGLEHSDTLAKLAGNVATYKAQIDMATSQLAIGSVAREADARLRTTNAQLEIFHNRINEIAVGLGAVALPALNRALKLVGSFVSDVADAKDGDKDARRRIVGAAVATGAEIVEAPAKLMSMAADPGGTIVRTMREPKETAGEPALPAPAPRPRFNATTMNKTTTQNNITIVQQPNQDSKQLAQEVVREIDRRNAAKQRSSLVDGAGVQ